MRALPRTRAALAIAATAALALTACSGGDDEESDSSSEDGGTTEDSGDETDSETTSDEAASDDSSSDDSADAGEWPRTITHDAGETEIPAQPERIVSTSITLTGTLLAIDAPVIASAATTAGPLTDDNGFFSQWADVAAEDGVEVAYPNLELDLDAVDSYAPDLIIVSSVGADAAVDAYDQLSEIAPTIVLDYGSSSWEDIAAELGEATGLEDEATAVVEEFDQYVADAAEQIAIPDGPVTALTYNGADGGNVFTENSAQASILTGLGFEYQAGPEDVASGVRSDVAQYTENLPAAIDGAQVAFVIAGGDDNAADMAADPLLANSAAVQNDQVLAVGPTSFRIDYYSGIQFVDAVVADFSE
jgi:iron complex transport system substrate-binding protein